MKRGFIKGDLVKITKSGSPIMTIISVLNDDYSILNETLKSQGFKNGDAVCQWFDRNNQLKEHTFSKDELILI